MKARWLMPCLFLTWSASVAAAPSMESLSAVEDASVRAAAQPSADQARALSGQPIDGGSWADGRGGEVRGKDRVAQAGALDPAPPAAVPRPPKDIPPPASPADSGGFSLKKLPPWMVYGGGAALGAVQGYLSGGLIGAAGGAVLGLGAAALYEQGHVAAAFGWTLGGIIGAFMGGPIGALMGAVLGAVAGQLAASFFK